MSHSTDPPVSVTVWGPRRPGSRNAERPGHPVRMAGRWCFS
jgi:hypothetical protein